MTLHDAIVRVLSEAGTKGMRVAEIARIINNRGLYRQQDGGPLTIHQTHARIRNYPRLFEIDKAIYPAVVRLRTGTTVDVAATEATSTSTLQATDEWSWEGNVQARIREYLVADGWEIRSESKTAARERGIDLLAAKGGRLLAIEVKGYPSTRYIRGTKKDDQKPNPQPTLQARHWYAQALLSCLMFKHKKQEVEMCLGLPDFPRYRALLAKTTFALKELSIGVFLVDEKGVVEKYKES